MQSFTPEHQGKDYLEQWERVKRWYTKVKEVELNIHQVNGVPIVEQEDYLYIFFLNLYHLKDWIKVFTNDKDIEKIFSRTEGSKNLKIVADFVTNIKHFENSKTTRIDSNTYFVSRDANVFIGGQNYVANQANMSPVHTWWIQSNDERLNVYTLAHDAFIEVKAYLIEQNFIE